MAGADANAKNPNGNTALDIARLYKQPDIIALLEPLLMTQEELIVFMLD